LAHTERPGARGRDGPTSRRTRVLGVAGIVAGVVAVALCTRALADGWDRVGDRVADASPPLLAAALACAAGTMLVVASGWPRVLHALGADVDAGDARRWYFRGELGKYVPGLVWPVVGRAELATRRGGVDRKLAYRSVVVSLAAWYGSPAAPLAARALRVRTGVVAAYLPSWLGVAATSVLVDAALGTGGEPWRVGAAAVGAWYAGFLAVPVPAGAGVREGAFAALGGLPAAEAVAVAVASRLCFVAVDLAGAAWPKSRPAR
jgi:hypothetical protein